MATIKKIKRICPICGKEFFAHPSIIKNGGGKYCSRECMGKSYRGEKSSNWKGGKVKCICKTCGKEFFLNPSEIELGKGKYCSKKCFGVSNAGKNSPSWKGGKIKVVCQMCGKEFETYSSTLKRGNGKYCSKECSNEAVRERQMGEKCLFWKGGKIKFICETCGEEFYVYKCRANKGNVKYCSMKCRGKAKTGMNSPQWKGGKIRCICEICEKEFFVTPSKIKSGGGKYCSVGCSRKSKRGESNHFWKGGTSFAPYCPRFNERRKKAVRDFFNNTCLACGKLASENVVGGKIFALCVHHADHDKEQGCNGKPFNLVPLCHECHGEEPYKEEEYRKYINKTLEDGFKWGIWNEEEYMEKVMYPDD